MKLRARCDDGKTQARPRGRARRIQPHEPLQHALPIGFGNARTCLDNALAANPNGLDPNYFYGDFLFREGDYAGSERALQKALAAPSRPGRGVSDRGRRAEAAALLEKVRARRQ